jgi:protein-tyrosine phosphatase
MIARRDVLMMSFAAIALPQTSLAAARLTGATCKRAADGRVTLTWSGPAAGVRMSNNPDGPFAKVLQANAKGQWAGPVPVAPRPYFRLSSQAGNLDVAERLLPLQGGRNFRDLGGYMTSDGRQVRWGRLFRSGSMVDLTAADYAYLSSLGIQVICDFRSTEERDQEPIRWSGANPPAMIARNYANASSSQGSLFAGNPDGPTVRLRMAKLYETLPYDHIESYRLMFSKLAAGQAPLAFNCSAGKDRTGVGAALLLTTLGVPWTTVLGDYTLTNDVINFETILQRSPKGKPPAGFNEVSQLSKDARAQLQRADPLYLQTAFSTIKRQEGSIAAFVRGRLGVSDDEVRSLRANLLRPV